MELVVVDASVAAKWVLGEAESAAANELLEKSQRLAAPALIKIEVAGAVLRRFRNGTLSEELAWSACDKWNRIVEDRFVHLIPVDTLYQAAVELAFRSRHALADCLYIAAAKSLDATLLTADRTLHERGLKVYDRVSLLAKAA